MRLRNRVGALPALLRTAATGFIPFLALFFAGCGETYRPVAQPLLGAQPSPGAAHSVMSISTNGVTDSHRDNGSSSTIDVSGDTVMGNMAVGIAPVHAALTLNGSKLYVANSAEDTVTTSNTFSPTVLAAKISLPASTSASITQVTGNGSIATYTYTGGTGFSVGDTVYVTGCSTVAFNGVFFVTAVGGTTFSVSNPTAATDSTENASAQAKIPNAVFAHTTENNNMYVAGYGTNSVYVINTTSNVVAATVPVGARPVALAELPNAQKLYVADQGSNSVSVISVANDTVIATINLSSPPVWAVSRSDSGRVYVLDKSGTINVIDPISDSVIDSTQSARAGANFMFYDKTFSRLYVTNPAAASLSIFEVAGNIPAPRSVNPIPIPTAASSPCTTAPVPTSVTVLGDGGRAYVASYQFGAATICTQVSVIDTGAGTVTKTIPLTQAADMSSQTACGKVGFRTFVTSSGGGTNSNFKVYVSQCDEGSVATIDTFPASSNPADFFAGVSLSPPLSSFPAGMSGLPPPQNPVFMVAGP